ncbi:MAG: hypothetical protein Q9182_004669 [Xanthomendoza sp. 2 TL-2023]
MGRQAKPTASNNDERNAKRRARYAEKKNLQKKTSNSTLASTAGPAPQDASTAPGAQVPPTTPRTPSRLAAFAPVVLLSPVSALGRKFTELFLRRASPVAPIPPQEEEPARSNLNKGEGSDVDKNSDGENEDSDTEQNFFPPDSPTPVRFAAPPSTDAGLSSLAQLRRSPSLRPDGIESESEDRSVGYHHAGTQTSPTLRPAPRLLDFTFNEDEELFIPYYPDPPAHIETLNLTDLTEAEVEPAATLCNQTLTRAMRPWCSCVPKPENYPSLPQNASSLSELADKWNNSLPEALRPTAPPGNPPGDEMRLAPTPLPLGEPGALPRDGRWNDFQAIPWSALLTGGEQPDNLDFAKSEERFLQHHPELRNLQLERTWDIDSCLGQLRTLAAHKHAFQLAYCPPYTRRITQNQRVTFEGHAAHRCKQMRLGFSAGDGGYGSSTHILFPNMPVYDETHVSDEHQRMWIDNVIRPAIKAACGRNIISRHPPSLKIAHGKAKMKREVLALHHGQPMDFRATVPQADLQCFWAAVQESANRIAIFRGAILVVSSHDRKGDTARQHPRITRRDWLDHFRSLYHTTPQYIVPDSIWVDFGVDEYAAIDPSPGITLLNKTACLDEWVKTFHDPGSDHARVKTARFPFLITRDAGSASVELLPKNTLRDVHGQAYHKRYNNIKELFTGPFKDVLPFCNRVLEAAGFDQVELNRWVAANRRGSAGYANPDVTEQNQTAANSNRQRVRQFYMDAKERIADALKTAMSGHEDYGVRHEYRIRMSSFEELDFESAVASWRHHEDMFPGLRRNQERDVNRFIPIDEIDNPQQWLGPNGAHRRFYILPTQEVAKFIAASINRWLLLIEATAALSRPGLHGLNPLNGEQQRTRGLVIAAMFRTLRLSLGGLEPTAFPRLWLQSWTQRKRRGTRRNPDGEERPRRRFCGLGFKEQVRRHGVSALPEEHFHWEGVPSLTRRFLHRSHLSNDFQAGFRAQPHIQAILTQHDRLLTGFRVKVQTALVTPDPGLALEAVITLGAELVIQEYVREVFRRVQGWICHGITGARNKEAAWIPHRNRLDDEELQGLRGLNHAMLVRLYGPGIQPRIASARPPRTDREGSRRQVWAENYKTGFWEDRLRGLFAWDDLPEECSPRGWENAGFRMLARSLHYIIETESQGLPRPVKYPRLFLSILYALAAVYLSIVPQYDLTRISVTFKANSHSDPIQQAAIRDLKPIERMNWWICHVPSEMASLLRFRYPAPDPGVEGRQELMAVRRWFLQTETKRDQPLGWWRQSGQSLDWKRTALTDPKAQLGQDLRLDHAADFQEAALEDPNNSDSSESNSDSDTGSAVTIESEFEVDEDD